MNINSQILQLSKIFLKQSAKSIKIVNDLPIEMNEPSFGPHNPQAGALSPFYKKVEEKNIDNIDNESETVFSKDDLEAIRLIIKDWEAIMEPLLLSGGSMRWVNLIPKLERRINKILLSIKESIDTNSAIYLQDKKIIKDIIRIWMKKAPEYHEHLNINDELIEKAKNILDKIDK